MTTRPASADALAPHPLGVEPLTRGFMAGTLDPVEITRQCLDRIARQDHSLKCFITVSVERALADATASRARWQAGAPQSACDGVPIAIKDNVDVAGLPCTAGTEAFRYRVPTHDALIARRLHDAGAVLLGKLNMHEAALGATTDNPGYGRCMNPLHPGHTPGGSSGGSGAAVAAGLVSMAIGTDTMGSIRIPAAYCGVFGFKPSWQHELNSGIVPLHHGFDSPGPLAGSAQDLARFSRLLLGWPANLNEDSSATRRGWTGLRIMRLDEAESIELDPRIRAGLESVSRSLTEAGASITRGGFPAWQPGGARRAGLLLCESEGHAWWKAALGDELPGLSGGLASLLRYPLGLPESRLAQARQAIDALRHAARELFARTDLLLLPTAPQTSFPHGEPAPANQADLTALANFIGAPALAVPIDCEGTAISVQLIAAPGRDDLLLSLAQAIDDIGQPSPTLPFARRV
jgi:aspartyl-tRNA(Asn)/glutamyl-tRNA(Gln) amidotransferase subunit A